MTEFLKGFKEASGEEDPSSVWAALSRQLSDKERAQIEAGGYDAGICEGYGYISWLSD